MIDARLISLSEYKRGDPDGSRASVFVCANSHDILVTRSSSGFSVAVAARRPLLTVSVRTVSAYEELHVSASSPSGGAVSVDFSRGLKLIQSSRPATMSSTPEAQAATVERSQPDSSNAGDASSTGAGGVLFPQSLEQKLSQCVDAACRDRVHKEADFNKDDEEEPPDRMSIGRAAWSLLHSSAATWEADPSIQAQQRRKEWMGAFFALFPCSQCRSHFLPYFQTHPPAVSGGRTSLSLWTCEAHNYVNEALQRPTFRCDATQLIRQWSATRWKDDEDDAE
ncbi:Erv1 / Alr family protein [Besnoitia besnoiti]|uniref:Sulfhydryl oxidase n=1 Tax=Besnoitia besnoiti TaxID=94643 RepID=A0A2A9M990_BESBE|nr:Erv1 / Alr family protein [Besnoitia besnoiti]PFH32187.1 Erv1 / Alr family protein [Besnoitia besnoiti]